MTREARKKQHIHDLYEKKEMLVALVEVWTRQCKMEEYVAENWAYLRELKRRKRIVETRLMNISL